MAKKVRVWKVDDESRVEVERSCLDLESRLEGWLEEDISPLSEDYLVIGRQVRTDFAGIMDILCIDERGDLVIIELKRDRTPRDITAQVLDYASWVQDLTNDDVVSLSNGYLGPRSDLETAYREKYGSELPDTLNQSHRMVIVGSDIDPKTERILAYLNDSYGVDINAVKFGYYQMPDGGEVVVRTYVIDPHEAERNVSKSPSKRKPNLTLDELREEAEANGVGGLYARLEDGLSCMLSRSTTRSALSLKGTLEGRRATMLNLIPGDSSAERGLRFQLYNRRLADFLGLDVARLQALLPEDAEPWTFDSTTEGDEYNSGYAGYFKDTESADVFIEGAASSAAKKHAQ
jgi:hypothetical protein